MENIGTALYLAGLCMVRDLLAGPADVCDPSTWAKNDAQATILSGLPSPWVNHHGEFATHPDLTWLQAHELLEWECYKLSPAPDDGDYGDYGDSGVPF